MSWLSTPMPDWLPAKTRPPLTRACELVAAHSFEAAQVLVAPRDQHDTADQGWDADREFQVAAPAAHATPHEYDARFGECALARNQRHHAAIRFAVCSDQMHAGRRELKALRTRLQIEPDDAVAFLYDDRGAGELRREARLRRDLPEQATRGDVVAIDLVRLTDPDPNRRRFAFGSGVDALHQERKIAFVVVGIARCERAGRARARGAAQQQNECAARASRPSSRGSVHAQH
jgi:hypothetical protein